MPNQTLLAAMDTPATFCAVLALRMHLEHNIGAGNMCEMNQTSALFGVNRKDLLMFQKKFQRMKGSLWQRVGVLGHI